jgi:hypothetical protein
VIDRFEDLHEDFLRHVLGLVSAREHPEEEPVDALAVQLDQLVERTLVARGEALDELQLVGIRLGHALTARATAERPP